MGSAKWRCWIAAALALATPCACFGAAQRAGPALAPSLGTFEVRNRAARLPGSAPAPAYVLTLDACGGSFDWELGRHLAAKGWSSTIFATKAFIDANPEAVAFLRSRPDLFEIQNHGAAHHAAIMRRGSLWRVPMAATPQGLRDEVQGGSRAIEAAFERRPTLFRGATAAYDEEGLRGVEALGFEVAGYEVSLDAGGSLSALQVMARTLNAPPGAVMLGHINRPSTRNGAKIAAALDAAAAGGAKFESWAKARDRGAVLHWRSDQPAPR